MKAVLSNRIYLESKDSDLHERLSTELTYKIPAKLKGRFPETIRNYSKIRQDLCTIPGGRIDLIPKGFEVIDKRTTALVQFPKFKFELRPSQADIYNSVDSSCIINAAPSWGKTFCGIAIATKLSNKTLVVTHTTMLRDQWVTEIEKTLGITPGVIGAGKVDTNSVIVVANIQTLIKRLDVLDEFGTLIIDECLDYETQINTLELGTVKLGVIVNNKKSVHVRSFDLTTNQEVYKKVVSWYKNPQSECLRIRHAAGSLKATNNHSFFIQSTEGIRKVMAGDLKIGDKLILTKNSHKANRSLNPKYLNVVLGCILGDGSISLDNPKTKSCRIHVTNGEDQLDYLLYKEKLLSSLDCSIAEGNSGYSDKLVYQVTTSSFIDEFNLRGSLYVNGKKSKVTQGIVNKLDRLSWSLIYQDDGSAGINNVSFSFCELDITSIHLLGGSLIANKLCDNYYIYTCARGFNYLKLDSNNSRIFYREIAEYIHPCMRYKLYGNENYCSFKEPTVLQLDLDYFTREITDIHEDVLTGSYRYNIEVEDTHTYFANNILVSNCHHTPATTFTTIVDKCKAKYKIGLSGTLERKDGKHVVFTDYFGTTIFRPEEENSMTPTVLLVDSEISFPGGKFWANRITELEVHRPEYRKLIVDLADAAANKGHKVLVVASRTDFLHTCAEMTKNPSICITGLVRDMAERNRLLELIASDEANICFGTLSIFSEGISQSALSCLILATPTNNKPMLTQLIGRIIRLKEGKRTPLIIDIELKGSSSVKAQLATRKSLYLQKGYKIQRLKK